MLLSFEHIRIGKYGAYRKGDPYVLLIVALARNQPALRRSYENLERVKMLL